jgi:hypothetical protein
MGPTEQDPHIVLDGGSFVPSFNVFWINVVGFGCMIIDTVSAVSNLTNKSLSVSNSSPMIIFSVPFSGMMWDGIIRLSCVW